MCTGNRKERNRTSSAGRREGGGSVEIQSKNFKEQGKSNGSHGNCKDEQIMNSTILIKKKREKKVNDKAFLIEKNAHSQKKTIHLSPFVVLRVFSLFL